MKNSISLGTPEPLRFAILIISLFILSWSPLTGQINLTFTDSSNASIQAMVTSVVPAGWMLIDKSQNIDVSAFFSASGRASAFGLSANDAMNEVSRDTISNRTVIKFQQYYKGIKVQHAQFTLHTLNDTLYVAHGYVQEGLTIDTSGMLSEEDALDIALDSMNIMLYDSTTSTYPAYAWRVQAWEDSLKVDLDDTLATHYPVGELSIVKKNNKWQPVTDNKLQWSFSVVSATPMVNFEIEVDALTGDITSMRSGGRTCHFGQTDGRFETFIETNSLEGTIDEDDVDIIPGNPWEIGTCLTSYDGVQNITTKKKSNSNWVLKDRTRSKALTTKIYTGSDNFWSANKVSNSTNTWPQNRHWSTSAHWGVQSAWDYFNSVFNWAGMDGTAKNKISIWSRWDGVYKPEFAITFSDPNPSQARYQFLRGRDYIWAADRACELDVIAHEYAHGVESNKSGLVLRGEYGILSEAISDMFGQLVEEDFNGSTDWVSGKLSSFYSIYPESKLGRSFQYPTSTFQPSFYGEGPYWIDSYEDDIAYFHKNTGPANNWFFGIAQPGVLGIERAGELLYRTISEYLQSFSTYEDMRLATFMVAVDIYGACAQEPTYVVDKWNMVKVPGDDLDACPNPIFAIVGDVIICEEDFADVGPFTYSAPNPNNLSVSWSVPSSWDTYTVGNTLIVRGIDFGSNPTFPQYETIYVTIGSNSDSQDIEIQDCENNGVILLSRPYDDGSVMQGLQSQDGFSENDPEDHDDAKEGIQIYPNPTSGEVTVLLPEEIVELGAEMHIFNSLGAHISQFKLSSSVSQIELPYSSGIYFSEIRVANRSTVYSTKIIIND